jgi:hypothetical protein
MYVATGALYITFSQKAGGMYQFSTTKSTLHNKEIKKGKRRPNYCTTPRAPYYCYITGTLTKKNHTPPNNHHLPMIYDLNAHPCRTKTINKNRYKNNKKSLV